MKIIFVPVADRPECAKALHSAFELARKLEASVVGCHMRPHSYSEISLSSYFPYEILGNGNRTLHSAWQKKTSAKSSKAARALYETMAEASGFQLSKSVKSGPVAVWQEKVGSPDKLMRISGPVSDLLIVSRPKTRKNKLATMFMLSALMESSRPVLILPQSGHKTAGEKICIAWNQSAHAMHAIVAAIPLLQRAAQVTVVSCGPENRLGPKSAQLRSYLGAWGVKAGVESTRGKNVDAELTTVYRDTGSDLIVMGAYSRSRWREVAFGGTSNFMLFEANIPVLMLHT
ncbi:MAG: universal stress protein [Gammaproteobacteria bacterium]|nr:universal stress protein [Gammaproteobacteria bacterium]MDH4314270.1 universal stress protein [Gammaproteobacteria bacterium]MDH5213655.1 universal stress protein [Gammaproteobacteria bacterium]MDH5500082.1 universal stress protein [Gammaproteobacteria bacterium]